MNKPIYTAPLIVYILLISCNQQDRKQKEADVINFDNVATSEFEIENPDFLKSGTTV